MQNMINGNDEEVGMHPKLIRTEKEYEAALIKIDQLMDDDPELDSSDAIILETLVILVEDYERKNFPIELPDPITAIQFCMEQQGLTRRDLEPYIGPRGRVSEILSGTRPLSLRMIRALNENLGIPAEILIRPGDSLDKKPDIEWGKFPLKEMILRGWVKDTKSSVELTVKSFFENLPSTEPLFQPLYRRSIHATRSDQEIDEYRLSAWAARIVLVALEKKLDVKYEPSLMNIESMRELVQLSVAKDGPLQAIDYLNQKGIHLVIEPHLSKTYLDGAAVLYSANTPVIGLTLRYDRPDNFWFTLVHELAHLNLGHINENEWIIYDQIFSNDGNPEDTNKLQKGSSSNRKEIEADNLAREALIPQEIWESSAASKFPTESAAIALANELNIHPAIVAGRIRYELKMYHHLNDLVEGSVKELFPEIHWR